MLWKLIGFILFVYVVFYLFKKRSLIPYRKGVQEILAGDACVGMEMLRKAYRQGLTHEQQVQVAYAELKFGEVREAKKILNLLLMDTKAKPPIKAQVRCMMAIIALQNKELTEAREILETLREDGMVNSNFYATYGYMAILTGEREYYIKANEEAYQYDPNHLVICDNYGLSLFHQGELEKAGDIYSNLIDKNPNFPEAYYNYACVLEKSGDIKKAVDMLSEALNQEFSGVTTIRREVVAAYHQSLRNQVAKEQ